MKGGRREGAGRKPGIPNSMPNPLRFDLLETLREKGFDPAANLVEVHLAALEMYKERCAAGGFGAVGFLGIARESAKDLMEFVYPKRKSVELTGAEGSPLFQSFTDLVKQIADEKKDL